MTAIVLSNGLKFSYENMFGEGRINEVSFEELLSTVGKTTHEQVNAIRVNGTAKGHLSKDGKPEHVCFMHMGYVKDGNPNRPQSIAKLKDYSAFVQAYDSVLFLGIGGSFLGNRVLFDALGHKNWNKDRDVRKQAPKIYFSGNNVDPVASEILAGELKRQADVYKLHNRPYKVMLVPISKSGTTMETMTAFLHYYSELSNCKDIELDVTVITDLQAKIENSPLLQVANKLNSWKFDVKEGIGGRFSVMTDVGLVTLAAMGGDIEEFLRGAREMDQYCQSAPLDKNPALVNALLKYMEYKNGKDIEVFMPYCFSLKSLSEWYVQLLAESLGKRYDRDGNIVNYGRTPIVAVGTTDMHAQTQQHQEGKLNKVVQFIEVENLGREVVLENPFPDIGHFEKYAGKKMSSLLRAALDANEAALTSDNRSNARFTIPKLNEYYLGAFMYFLMLSVAYEGELANVDAYDQPGVEIYKRFMKEKLEKA